MTTQSRILARPFWSFPGVFLRLRAHREELAAAQAARLRHLSLSETDLDDIGMTGEDVLGTPSHQPALPFFLQPGFQEHRL